MRRCDALMVVAITGLGIALTGCSEEAPAAAHEEPAHVEYDEGSEQGRLVLSAHAEERLGIRTVPVVSSESGASVIPFAAVIYDAEGGTWTYTAGGEPGEYQRQAITFDAVDGDDVVLTDGPLVGTDVVTVGGAELLGTELDVGH